MRVDERMLLRDVALNHFVNALVEYCMVYVVGWVLGGGYCWEVGGGIE